jgi:hypothetical protein
MVTARAAAGQRHRPLQQASRQARASSKCSTPPPRTRAAISRRAGPGDVEFRDVSFTYDKEGRVLAGISFVSPRGDGRNRWPLGRRQVDAGEPAASIPRPGFRGGPAGRHRHSQYRRRDLRNQLAMVSQDVMLVDDTIANNIAFSAAVAMPEPCDVLRKPRTCWNSPRSAAGTRDADRRSRHAAVRRAAPARRDRTRDPEGCAGLILDEATRRSMRVRAPRADRARELLKGRTRLSSRTGFPRSRRGSHHRHGRGRIVESGTHAALIAVGGTYAALHRMQFNV